MTPVRLTLSRKRDFRLAEVSLAANGLPARVVTRATPFGNPFKVGGDTTPANAVRLFRKFLAVWPDRLIYEGVRDADGDPLPIDGLFLIVARNRMRARLWQLAGHNLACFCPVGQPCHADVLLDFANSNRAARWKARYPKLCEETRKDRR